MATDQHEGFDGEEAEHLSTAWQEGPFELGVDGPRVLVVGIDGSDTALRAAAYATGLARRQGSRVVFVYVRGGASAGSVAAPGIVAAETEVQDELLAGFREALNARMPELGVAWELRAVTGDVAAEITRYADKVRADAVVVGASAQFGHRIAGSVAVRLVKARRWPVIVVP